MLDFLVSPFLERDLNRNSCAYQRYTLTFHGVDSLEKAAAYQECKKY